MDKSYRDALALAAMQGILAYDGCTQSERAVAAQAYRIADAMLEESERVCVECGAQRNSIGNLFHRADCPHWKAQ